MLSKCANSQCGAPFRNLKEGRVYVAEYYDEGDVCMLAGAPHAAGKRTSRHEMFWLCGACDRAFVLTAKGNAVVPVARGKLGQGEYPLREVRLAG